MGVLNRLCSKKKKGGSDLGDPEPLKSQELELKDEIEINPNQEETGRIQWSSPTEFLLTCIGYSVGLGNVWRFPYLCYKSGGGAFLIPYMMMIGLIGMPLLFMEYGFGQYFGVGSLSIYKKVCPMLQGIGIGYTVLNALVCIYYNVIIALSLYYLFASFQRTLPWSHCNNEWNTPQCGDPVNIDVNATMNSTQMFANMTGSLDGSTNYDIGNSTNTSLFNASLPRSSPSDEYFRLALMNVGPEHSIENIGHVQWRICLCLLLAWVLVVLFVSKGIKSTGKVAYFTATFPYVMLTVLVVRGVTLPGATEGILYFVTPDFQKLKDPEVWFAAATQLFYSTNLAWGGMITMASYNSFSHNCYRDAIMINIVSFFTSIYAGFAVFSIIGYMANEYGRNIDEIIDSGPGLAFIVYPRALSLMPLAPMWSALFFFMLFLLGVGSQMVIYETVMTGFVDEFPILGRKTGSRILTAGLMACIFFMAGLPMATQMVQVETIVTGIVDNYPSLGTTWLLRIRTVIIAVAMTFLLGIPMTCQGGMYVLQLMDHYSAGFCVLIIAIFECVCINWIYGIDRFKANIKEMIGQNPGRWWVISWRFISPSIIVAILVFSFVKYTPAKYGSYEYPVWADSIGWCLTLASVIPIFVVAFYKVARADGNTLREKIYNVSKPQIDIEVKKPMHPHVTIDITAEPHHTQQLLVENHHNSNNHSTDQNSHV